MPKKYNTKLSTDRLRDTAVKLEHCLADEQKTFVNDLKASFSDILSETLGRTYLEVASPQAKRKKTQ